MKPENAIEITGLQKHYPAFTLGELNLRLPQGAILGLVGANGAGKTTLIRLIMNAAQRDSGMIRVLGVDNQSADFSRIKQDIGIVLDEAHFPDSLTPKQLGMVMASAYQNWSDTQYADYLERFRLPADSAFTTFSRGMKMKLALATALSHDARLLILDEPTSGLDPVVREEILDLLFEFTRQEEHSILISSHIVSDLEKICDYVAFIQQGNLVLCSEKDALLQQFALLNTTQDKLNDLDPKACISFRTTPYGVQVLVNRQRIPPTFTTEHTTLEDIILFFAREVDH